MEEPVDNNVEAADDFAISPLHHGLRLLSYIIGGPGIIGNLFVVVVTLRHTKLWRHLTCKYIVNQSLIDALIMVVFVVRVQTTPDESKLLASLDDLQAVVYYRLWSSPFLLYGLLLSSAYNLVAVSVERYIGIVRPMWHKVAVTHYRVTLSIVAIWLLGVSYTACVVSVPSRMAGEECQPARNWPSEGVKIFVGSLTLCVSLMLPLFIHGFCYARINVALRMRIELDVPSIAAAASVWPTCVLLVAAADRTLVNITIASETVAVTAATSNTGQSAANSTRKRAVNKVLKTLALVTVTFVVCWMPNKCYAFLCLIGVTSSIGQAYHITVGLALLHCCVNPFIYIVHFTECWEGVTVMCGCKRRVQ